jgi:hypothetical protein
METREIPRSNGKGVMLTLGSLAFVVAGVWMLVRGGRHEGLPTPIIGGVAVVFFGACLVYGVRVLLDRSPGFVLRADGFEDRSSGVAVGFVPWRDVREIAVMSITGQRFITVRVNNPEVYAARGSAIQRLARRANARMCGTPITISTNTLRVSFDELMRLLEAGARG